MKTAKRLAVAETCCTWSRSEKTRERCRHCNFIDTVCESPEEAVADADVVVACVPVDRIVPLLSQVAGTVKKGALVTDVGSTKAAICKDAKTSLPRELRFVGSHPMAGIERNGIDEARDDLFENRLALVTPLPDTAPDIVDDAKSFWQSLGMRTHSLSPAEHDKIVAHVSHLPQAVAVALAGTLATQPLQWRDFGAGGMRDTTRIAAGTPEVWQAIFEENRKEVLPALDTYLKLFGELRDALADNNSQKLATILKLASDWRSKLK
ncbi:MAG: prephenate dehydrogenase [Opitutales bacterium]|nr:prephenate dehydrogenase [Opitutales bacterium]